MKIFVDEVSAFAIHGIREFLGFLLRLAARQQASYLIFHRGIQKYTECVGTILKKKLRSSSDNHAVSRARCMPDNTLCHLQNVFAIDQVQFVRIDASLVTAAQE